MLARRYLPAALVTLVLGTAHAQDPYDAARMDLKPAPSKTTSERHTGRRSPRAPRSAWARS